MKCHLLPCKLRAKMALARVRSIINIIKRGDIISFLCFRFSYLTYYPYLCDMKTDKMTQTV